MSNTFLITPVVIMKSNQIKLIPFIDRYEFLVLCQEDIMVTIPLSLYSGPSFLAE